LGVNSGLRACEAGAVLLEPRFQPSVVHFTPQVSCYALPSIVGTTSYHVFSGFSLELHCLLKYMYNINVYIYTHSCPHVCFLCVYLYMYMCILFCLLGIEPSTHSHILGN
jgi:hypothetical protein